MNSRLKGPLVGLTFFCILMVLTEVLAGLFIDPPDRLDRIHAVLREDGDLIWRQRAQLQQDFEGAQIRTNRFGYRADEFETKKGRQLRVVTMGASPTFGWGVKQDQTYAAKLEDKLQNYVPDDLSVEVINAGQIGFSSYQGRKLFLNEIVRLNPDIITVSYVINDVDKYRFFRNNGLADRDLKPMNLVLIEIQNVLKVSNFYQLFSDVVRKTQSVSLQTLGVRNAETYNETRRVSINDYRKNLNEIVITARNLGIEVILIKMPVNLPEADQVSFEQQQEADTIINETMRVYKGSGVYRSIKKLEEARELDPHTPKVYYYLGQAHQDLGNKEKARRYFEMTVIKELHKCAVVSKSYNNTMGRVAQGYGVGLVDVVDAFERVQAGGEYLFLDPNQDTIHPNARGHEVIAQLVFEQLKSNPAVKRHLAGQ